MLKKRLTKAIGTLALASACMITSVPSASAGNGASADANMYAWQGALEGGVYVSGGYEYVSSMHAYYELWRDGKKLGTKYDESMNWYLSRSAIALITEGVHTQSGEYYMTWSGRVTGYTLTGGDWSRSGNLTYTKN